MKIAMAQMNPATGDLRGNAEKICEALRRARRKGCHLVVTPELAITGYMSGDLLEVDAYVEANLRMLREVIVPECVGITAVIGFVERTDSGGPGGRLHNAAAVVQDGRMLTVARKRNLCRYRFFDETRYFVPGDETTVAELDLAGRRTRAGVLICEDLWDGGYPAAPYREAGEAGAELIVTLNASPFESGKWDERIALVARQQRRLPLPLVYANTVGIGDNLKDIILFDGRSLVSDAAGEIVASGPLFAEDLVVAELDDGFRGEPKIPPRWSEEEELRAGLTFALHDYGRQVGFSRVVLGLSGGIDSSLCAALAAEALGAENVLAVALPSRFTSAASREGAEVVCRNLGVELLEIPIERVHAAARATLEERIAVERGVTDENLQARIRGLLLMAVSNESGRMVVATGNKTELGLGYCTLYGDMVGGLLLLGDVNKQQVYRLAEHLNARAGGEIVPRAVLDRKPTAELAADQVDPFDYPVVAPLIDDLIARAGPQEIVARFASGELGDRYPDDLGDRHDAEAFRALVADVYDRYQKSAFKRAQASPTVVVSRRALGFDLRETIINHWRMDD